MKRKSRISLVTAGAAALLALTATTALATPYPVTVWGTTAATHVLGATSTSVQISAGSLVACGSSSTSGTSNTVTAAALVAPAFTFPALTFSSCGTWKVTQLPAWDFEASSGVTSGSDTAVTGHLDNVAFQVSNALIPSICTFRVEGRASATYDETSGRLAINEQSLSGILSVSSVSGCGGSIAIGDPATFVATYQFTTVGGLTFAPNAINIG